MSDNDVLDRPPTSADEPVLELARAIARSLAREHHRADEERRRRGHPQNRED